MKYCSMCDKTKPISEFGKNSSRYDGLQVYCRLCRKQVDKLSYERDPTKQRERNRQTILRNKRNAWQYLKEHPCIDCGVDNPIVLTFDHVRGKKEGAIARMINECFSWKTILAEIDKCVVRCSNCHMIKTAQERGWHKLKFAAASLEVIEEAR